MSANDYHPFVPKPHETKIAGPTAREHAQTRMKSPRAEGLFAKWEEMFNEPFRGITTAGTAAPGLFARQPEGAPTRAMIEAVNALLGLMSPEQRKASCFPADSPQWRHWQNTELYVENYGLRLDEVSEPLRECTMAVLRASMSRHGYELSRDVMKLNRFLGDLVGGPAVMGEWSYIFCLFGRPSMSEPWGWQLFGHHLVLNCFVLGEQMVLTPAFWGAEPSYADHGPFKGIRIFQDEERAGLKLMRSFSAEQQKRAIVAHSMMGGDLPEGRRHFADNLHLGGAFQDNRIVPYEGLKGSELQRLAAARADGPGRQVSILPGRRAAPGPDCGGRAASRRNALLLDRRVQRGEPVLLPAAEPGDLHRVRPSRRRFPHQCGAREVPRPYHRAHPQRQRLRIRSAEAALPAFRRTISRRSNSRRGTKAASDTARRPSPRTWPAPVSSRRSQTRSASW